jgi:hypothetical protein
MDIVAKEFFMSQWLEQSLGALIIHTRPARRVSHGALRARAGTGIFSDRLARLTWRVFRLASKPLGRHRGIVLSLCGPVILVLFVSLWHYGLTLGTARIIHPRLGTSLTAGSGETPTDFIPALFAGGSSTSVVGAGDFKPQTSGLRLFYLFTSLVGTALPRRNSLGLKIHLASAETADAAELLAGLGPKGKFDGGYNNLSDMAVGMSEVKESHHFYAVLSYFRFRSSYYSVSQTTLIALDAVTIIKSGSDDEKYAWLKESASVEQLWRASMLLLTTVGKRSSPMGYRSRNTHPMSRHANAGGSDTTPPCGGCAKRRLRPSPTNKPALKLTSACAPVGIITSRRSCRRWLIKWMNWRSTRYHSWAACRTWRCSMCSRRNSQVKLLQRRRK